MVAAAIEALPVSSPPASPAIGSCYIVGAGPSGEWLGHAGQLAAYTGGGWRFLAPRDGMTAYVKSDGSTALYHDAAWEIGTLRGSELIVDGQKVVGPRAAAIATPTAGTTTDLEARAAIGQILTALREHGLIEM